MIRDQVRDHDVATPIIDPSRAWKPLIMHAITTHRKAQKDCYGIDLGAIIALKGSTNEITVSRQSRPMRVLHSACKDHLNTIVL